jgi:Bacterial antitoxin of type II TA system, VapB
MRTNIDIDDKLMAAALKATGLKTKREVLEAGLEKLVRAQKQMQGLKYFGKVPWEGNLRSMRLGLPDHLKSPQEQGYDDIGKKRRTSK